MDKTLHHHTWLVLRPLFDTPVLILLQSARKTSLDKLILRPCCGCCVAISILKPGVKGGRERWCKVLSINRHILGLGHNFGMRANMGYNDCKPVIVASMLRGHAHKQGMQLLPGSNCARACAGVWTSVRAGICSGVRTATRRQRWLGCLCMHSYPQAYRRPRHRWCWCSLWHVNR